MGNVMPDEWIDSMQSVMNLMQAELDKLIAHKAELGRRKRALYRLLDSLVEGPRNRQRRGVGAFKSSRLRAQANRARASARDSCRIQNKLRRACRIALMEAGGLATPDQIHSHIVRRASFSFAGLDENPRLAIIRTLNLMAEAGETNRLTSTPDSWQLTKSNRSCSS